MVTLVIVVLIMINLIGCNKLNSDMEEYTIDEKGEQSLDNIENIIIEGFYLNINVAISDNNDLTYKLSGKLNLNLSNNIDDKGNIECYVKEKNLMIVLNKESDLIQYNNNSLSLDIEIPKEYYKNLSISASYSSISIEDLNLNELAIDSNKGEIYIENCTSNNFLAMVDRVDFRSDKLNTNKAYIEMINGNISLKNYIGDIEIYSSEANIDIECVKSDNNLEVWNQIGSIDLYLPKEATFKLDARTNVGYVKCEFPIPINEISSNEGVKGTVFNDNNSVIINNNEGSIKIMKEK
jgi:lia operon protein LiaG